MKHKTRNIKHKARNMRQKMLHAPCSMRRGSRGFVLLFTVVICSIILAITLGIASINYKSQTLSAQARDSDIAFFAADTGIECGLYADRKGTDVFPIPADSSVPITISCGSTSITSYGIDNYDGAGTAYYNFSLPTNGIPTGSGCAHLTVYKNTKIGTDPSTGDDILGTKIEALGYNVHCDQVSNVSNPRIVERALRASYP